MANGKDFGTVLGGIALGIIGGMVAAAIIDALTPPKCPYCGSVVHKGDQVCGTCREPLYWRHA